MPRSSVSKLLQDLEQHLGTKLVERSTRALTITPEGEAYRDLALGLLADLDAMDAAAGQARSSPRGRLRVDVGSSLANLVIIYLGEGGLDVGRWSTELHGDPAARR
ncbi:LysR family transcriptional regulator [Methylobacterium sp. 10]|uniref:LysR family transcriptional regulator n=1 Tax=Methylobacterium sp. 10 TaxID=1101191 RepID=UPI001FDA4747|nr:LysR family transcriptional regulator [Methylobacterium sp. 10]